MKLLKKKKNNFSRSKNAFTLIELIFCAAIISILIISLSSSINYNLSANMRLNAARYAWALADSVLQSDIFETRKYENNNIEYTATIKMENKKVKDIIKITSSTVELPDLEIPFKIVEVTWIFDNKEQKIIVDKTDF